LTSVAKVVVPATTVAPVADGRVKREARRQDADE